MTVRGIYYSSQEVYALGSAVTSVSQVQGDSPQATCFDSPNTTKNQCVRERMADLLL